MIKRETIDRLPTALREQIYNHFSECAARAERAASEQAMAYVATTDEKHRSLALTTQGEANAFQTIAQIFKLEG